MPSEPPLVEPTAAQDGTIADSTAGDLDIRLAVQIDVLRRTYDQLVSSDFERDVLADLAAAAHELQDQAGTVGYPLAGSVAVSLCDLIDGTPDVDRLPRTLVRQHVEAIRAIVAERASGQDHAVAKKLSDTLRRVTAEFVETEADRAVAA